MLNYVFAFLGVVTAVATYFYLDWSIWQILGAALVVTIVFDLEEKAPVWRKFLWSTLALSLMVLVHFIVADNVIYWAEIILSVVLFLVAIGALMGMVNHKPGDGSVLTFNFLLLIVSLPIATFVLYDGLSGLGYL